MNCAGFFTRLLQINWMFWTTVRHGSSYRITMHRTVKPISIGLQTSFHKTIKRSSLFRTLIYNIGQKELTLGARGLFFRSELKLRLWAAQLGLWAAPLWLWAAQLRMWAAQLRLRAAQLRLSTPQPPSRSWQERKTTLSTQQLQASLPCELLLNSVIDWSLYLVPNVSTS